jgi:hypothetical protein
MMDPDVAKFLQVMLSLVLTGGVGYGVFILVSALGRKLGDPGQAAGIGPDDLELLRAQAAEVDDLRLRLAELEERVDFAERLLAQQGAGPRLGSGE